MTSFLSILLSPPLFQGFVCDKADGKPVVVFLYYHIFIIVTGWVVLSLFIGVMSSAMFEAFETVKVVLCPQLASNISC